MKKAFILIAIIGLALSIASVFHKSTGEHGAGSASGTSAANNQSGFYRGVLVDAGMVTPAAIKEWTTHHQSIVLFISPTNIQSSLIAAQTILESAGSVEYFFEIARDPELAQRFPEWMASLQGHPEWMRFYPGFQQADDNHVTKNFPWVPIFYQEAFDAHLARLKDALEILPKPRRVWLNDIQGAPSACGCGHTLCRWTADYGPKTTARFIGNSAPALFTSAVAGLVPESEVIPILSGECEESDIDGPCAGVGCFKGICWKALTQQLDPLSESSPIIGINNLYQALERNLERYGPPGSWAQFSIQSFHSMPPLRGGRGIPPQRIISLLQGFDVPQEAVLTQLSSVQASRAAGYLLALTPVEQSWKPVTIPYTPHP